MQLQSHRELKEIYCFPGFQVILLGPWRSCPAIPLLYIIIHQLRSRSLACLVKVLKQVPDIIVLYTTRGREGFSRALILEILLY